MNSTTTDEYNWVAQLCPVCEGLPTRFLGTRGGRAHRQNLGVESEIWQCERCELIFPNPMPVPKGGISQHYELPPENYFEHHTTEGKNYSALGLLEQAHELNGRAGSLIDIGSGRGELLRVARETGWQAVGIEPSSSFAAHASNYSGVEVLTEPIEKCSLPAGSFDVTILSGVLEHVYNPDEVMRAIADTLRPGGFLFLDVPNEKGLYFQLGNLYHRLRGRKWIVNLSPTWPPFHVFGFGPKSLRMLLAKHGFEVVIWRCYSSNACVPSGASMVAKIERRAADVVTRLSNHADMGTFIACWAVKR